MGAIAFQCAQAGDDAGELTGRVDAVERAQLLAGEVRKLLIELREGRSTRRGQLRNVLRRSIFGPSLDLRGGMIT